MHCPACDVRMKADDAYAYAYDAKSMMAWSCPICGYEVEVRQSSLGFHFRFESNTYGDRPVQPNEDFHTHPVRSA
jgi:transcription initiation factor IIE alpha subunit